MGKIAKNHEDLSFPEPPPPPKKRGMLVLSPEDMQETEKSIKEKGIKAEDVKNLPPIAKAVWAYYSPSYGRGTLSFRVHSKWHP